MRTEGHQLRVRGNLQVLNPGIRLVGVVGWRGAQGGKGLCVYQMDEAGEVSCNQELAVACPVNRCEVLSKLLTRQNHLVILPKSDGLISTTGSKYLLCGVHGTAPDLSFWGTSKVAIDVCLYLSSACRIDLNDLRTTGAGQQGLSRVKIIQRADTCRELRHGGEIYGLLGGECLVPHDHLAIVASSQDHGLVLNVDYLPESIGMLLDGLPDAPAVPHG